MDLDFMFCWLGSRLLPCHQKVDDMAANCHMLVKFYYMRNLKFTSTFGISLNFVKNYLKIHSNLIKMYKKKLSKITKNETKKFKICKALYFNFYSNWYFPTWFTWNHTLSLGEQLIALLQTLGKLYLYSRRKKWIKS